MKQLYYAYDNSDGIVITDHSGNYALLFQRSSEKPKTWAEIVYTTWPRYTKADWSLVKTIGITKDTHWTPIPIPKETQ